MSFLFAYLFALWECLLNEGVLNVPFPFSWAPRIPSVFCVFSPPQADAVCDWIREMMAQLSPHEAQSLGHSEVPRVSAVSWIKVPGLHMRHQGAKSHSSPWPCRKRQTRALCSSSCSSREGLPGSCWMDTAADSSSSAGAGKAKLQQRGPFLLKLRAMGPQISCNCSKSSLFLALPRRHPEASHSCPVFLPLPTATLGTELGCQLASSLKAVLAFSYTNQASSYQLSSCLQE